MFEINFITITVFPPFFNGRFYGLRQDKVAHNSCIYVIIRYSNIYNSVIITIVSSFFVWLSCLKPITHQLIGFHEK